MIDLYTFSTSNGQRAAIILEECGLPFRLHRIDLTKGEHKTPEFLNINPAGAIPAIVDPDGPGGAPLKLSQSGAIMLYAAQKAGRFLPLDPLRRALALQWLLFAVTDVARASTSIFLCSTIVPEKSPANVAFFEEQTRATCAWPISVWPGTNFLPTSSRSPILRSTRSTRYARPSSTGPTTCRSSPDGVRRWHCARA